MFEYKYNMLYKIYFEQLSALLAYLTNTQKNSSAYKKVLLGRCLLKIKLSILIYVLEV